MTTLSRPRIIWWHTVRYFFLLAGWLPFRTRAIGVERLPKDGPYLLLPNHTSMFDPFWAGAAHKRHIFFMASRQIFRLPFLGKLLASVGAFPKVKFVKDRAAMATLQRLYEAGDVITIFPEGERSWDGEPTPVLPGIGRLIKRLDGRVVFCRILTGHLFHPRWARWPRWVRVVIEFSEPVTFPEHATVEEITAEVQRRIHIEPDQVKATGPRWGWHLADGIDGYLWACPVCHAVGALRPDGNHVGCGACGARWRLNVDAELIPETEDTPRFTVPTAHRAMAAPFGMPPVLDRARFDTDGVVMEGDRARVGRVVRGAQPEPLAEGRLQLTTDTLRLVDPDSGDERWSVRLQDLRAVSMEFQEKLQIRTEEDLFQVDTDEQATTMWVFFLRPWYSQARFGDAEGWRPR